MAEYTRPKEGFRFAFAGMKVNSSPDSLPQGKYPLAINIRSYTGSSIGTRPGTTQLFTTGNSFTTDLRAYAALQTDDLPRILTRNNDDSIWLDNAVQVGSLAGGGGSLGATLVSFRPNASPNPYMYIANGLDYQKFSAPDNSNNVRQFKVGMPEPQQAPDAAIGLNNQVALSNSPASFASGGTAGALVGGTRVSDVIGVVRTDPAGGDFSFQVTASAVAKYQQRMSLSEGGTPNWLVRDIIPPLTNSYNILRIFYFTGTTGRCVIVPAGLSPDTTSGESIYKESLIVSLRRGALIKVSSEICFVWSVTEGPDGSVAIETSTTINHVAGELLTGVPALRTTHPVAGFPIAGQAITAPTLIFTVGAGIGTQTRSSLGASPFALMQPDDYISFALKVDNLLNLNEMKILFDVSDGTFTKDFFYYTVRPADIQAGIANSSTQLSAIQTIAQRALIDQEKAIAAGNQQSAFSSAQTEAGSNVWSQIVFSLRELTRVGGDATKNLQTVVAMQLLFNGSGTINVEFDQVISFFGGFQPDVSDVGAPYRYRVRPRSTITGVKGNPSPATRYGVSPRREAVSVTSPVIPVTDNQMDTLDFFRYGGTVTSWRWIGAIEYFGGVAASFTDNISDDAAGTGEELEFDNYEPWPSVGLPNTGQANVTGTIVTILNSTDPNVPFYLPGTLIQLLLGTPSPLVFTLRNRPIALGGNNYLLELVENAGVALSTAIYIIQEPLIANQKLPYMWGPDVNGTIFAVGDSLNPGKLYYAKGNSPDSAPDSFNIEITPPPEPLLGGEVVDGLSFVGSTERWWALYPQPDNPLQRYNFVQQPIPRGIAAPFGHCTDGISIFFWAKDGIWSTTKGSLTDEDLYTLFPHEGVAGESYSYNGVIIQAPDYSQVGKFRLAHSNGYLYATYIGFDGQYHQLTLRFDTMAWCYDLYPAPVSCVYHVEQQAASGSTVNPVLLLAGRVVGSFNGSIHQQTPRTNDVGGPISCILATNEFDGGDIRAGEQWGDVYLDALPAAKGGPLLVTPMSLGAQISSTQTIPQSIARTPQPVSLGGQVLSNFLGLFLQWIDDFTQQPTETRLFIWQPSFIPKPETITDRISDWDDAGIDGAKWIQGFIMHADTFNVVKGLLARDSDTLAIHPFTPAVQHNGESEIAYSFNNPFIAHQVRVEPSDVTPWRLFDLRWIAEPTPEFAEVWTTQLSTHGLRGFMHLRQASITYAATAPVTFTVRVFDGTSPAVITLPSTFGAVEKIVVPFTFNKGQLYSYSFQCGNPFQIYQDKCEVLVGQWGREEGYINRPLVGSAGGDEAKI